MHSTNQYSIHELRSSIISCFKEPTFSSDCIVAKEFSFAKWRERTDWIREKSLAKYGTLPAEHVLRVLISRKYRKGKLSSVLRSSIKKYVREIINQNVPLKIVLPSFPFKSIEISKCRRRIPDIAELASLTHLWLLTEMIRYGYGIGMHIFILSDGLALRHAYNISSYHCIIYMKKIEQWLKEAGFEKSISILNFNEIITQNFPTFWSRMSSRMSLINYENHPQFQSVFRSFFNNISTKVLAPSIMHSSLLGNLNIVNESIEDRANQAKGASSYYLAFWDLIQEMNVIEKVFPSAIRLSPHDYRDDRMTIHLLNERQTILPWMGVGVIKKKGTIREDAITARKEVDVIMSNIWKPVFLNGEETPFAYLEEDINHAN